MFIPINFFPFFSFLFFFLFHRFIIIFLVDLFFFSLSFLFKIQSSLQGFAIFHAINPNAGQSISGRGDKTGSLS